MAKYSDKRMGKEVGTAAVYAPPHTMTGKAVSGQISKVPYATDKAAKDVGVADPVPNGMSYGMAGEPKTTGIKIRGTGAATKGVMMRGPVA